VIQGGGEAVPKLLAAPTFGTKRREKMPEASSRLQNAKKRQSVDTLRYRHLSCQMARSKKFWHEFWQEGLIENQRVTKKMVCCHKFQTIHGCRRKRGINQWFKGNFW